MIAVRRLILATLSGAALVLAGCASPAHEPAPPQEQHYTESISSVLVSEDGTHMAAIGSDHHYIFDAPPVLYRALHSSVHAQLAATFSTFHVDPHDVVTGEYTLALPAGASPEAQKAAADIGLQLGADGRWQTSGVLKGHRFTGWTYRAGREQDKLNKAYTIEFTTDLNAADTAVDHAATPIRATADGVQMLYYAPLAPIVLPIIFLSRARDH